MDRKIDCGKGGGEVERLKVVRGKGGGGGDGGGKIYSGKRKEDQVERLKEVRRAREGGGSEKIDSGKGERSIDRKIDSGKGGTSMDGKINTGKGKEDEVERLKVVRGGRMREGVERLIVVREKGAWMERLIVVRGRRMR